MNQTPLFFEDIYEAMKEGVRAIGGFKKAGVMLWPDCPEAEARSKLNNCLDRNRPEKLSAEQFLMLLREARKANCHAAINFICADTGYSQPKPVDPEDEKAELQRAYIEAVKFQRQLAERMERLWVPDAGLRSVS